MGRGAEGVGPGVSERPASGPAPQTASSLLSDPRLQPFLANTFDSAGFASAALTHTGTTAVEQAGELQVGIRRLGDQIREEVNGRYAELLAHSCRLHDSEASLQGVRLSVESLRGAMDRVAEEIMEPYLAMQSKTTQLSNLHTTTDLLRHVLQRLKLVAKLRQQLASKSSGGASLDLAKAAKFLTDAKAVGEEVDLSGIEVLSSDNEFLSSAEQQLSKEAQSVLIKGMASLSQAEVGSALQVYYNLQQLCPAVNGLLQQYEASLSHSLGSALDARKLTAAARTAAGTPPGQSSPGGTGASAAAEELWARLGRFGEGLHAAGVAVWHLQRVLAKKRDPLTHECFEGLILRDGETLLQRFWAGSTDLLRSRLAEAAQGRDFVREALIQGYPRLAAQLESVFAKLARDTDIKGVEPAATPAQRTMLLAATEQFLEAYLGASTRRLTDAVSLAFPGQASRPVPGATEVQRLVGRLYDELKSASASESLSLAFAERVGDSLALLAERATYMAAAGPELRQLGGAANAGQQRNVALCSSLQEVYRAAAGLIPRLAAPVAEALRAPLEAIRAAAVEAVAPIFRAAVEAAEQRILAIHSEPFGHDVQTYETATSPFVEDLSRLLSYFRSEFLARFSPAPTPGSLPTFASALTERMACRVLVLFVRHASILRPLSQAGKLRLTKDMAELEAAVASSLCPLEQLGHPYRMLRAFRPLLFQDSATLLGSPLLKELPTAVVLHHLYSRAPPALQSPLDQGSLSPAQWSLWLDQHSGSDAVSRIFSAIKASKAEAEPQDTAGVIPLMLQLCETHNSASKKALGQ